MHKNQKRTVNMNKFDKNTLFLNKNQEFFE